MTQSTNQLSYEDAWSFLDQLQFFKIKLGLDAMMTFMEPLGNPHLKFPCIHIGGTNGKGSVGSTLLSILTAAGYKVGFYTSPHLSSVRERFRIGNTFISEKDFALHAEQIINILDERQITYFEFATTLAMLWFAESNIDLVILEVGLGGRLDATNIVTPLASVITNVSMDHELHLGNTIVQVATEKAGIIKPGVPVITGTSDKKALQVISDTATKLKSPLHILDRDFSGSMLNDKNTWHYQGVHTLNDPELPINMKGAYQVANASLALATLEIVHTSFPVDQDHIHQGLKNVHWPGRLEEFWQTKDGEILRNPDQTNESCYHFLLDGAHNPDGALALKATLEKDFYYNDLILVWASMSDKDTQATLLQIAPMARNIIFTKPDEERSAEPETLKKLLPEQLRQQSQCIQSVNLALDRAKELFEPGAMICIAGSLYLVGKARQILCGELVDNA